MISKIKGGNYFGKLLCYQMDVNKGNLLDSNMIGDNSIVMAEQMEIVADLNKNVEKPTKHFVLSFSDDDASKLNDDTLENIAKEYLDKMGFSNNQYVIVKHTDTERLHLHIGCNRVMFDGVCVSDSNEKLKSRNILRALENKYDLTRTSKSFESKYENWNKNQPYHEDRIKNEPDVETFIREHVKDVLKKHPISLNHMTELLQAKGIKLEVSDNKKGVTFEINNTRIKGSYLNRNYSFKKLSSTLESNAHYQFNEAIKSTLNKDDVLSFESFFEDLKDQGFTPALNSVGNGWTLAKHDVKIKGYLLNRMSFKKINDFLNDKLTKRINKEIKSSVFDFFKSQGSEYPNLVQELESKGISILFESGEYCFNKGDIKLSEKEIGGRITKYGINSLLELNQVDNVLDALCKDGTKREHLEKGLLGYGIILEEKNGFRYKLSNQNIITGNDLYKFNDSKLLERLEINRITSTIYKYARSSNTSNEFVNSLFKENIHVTFKGEKLEYISKDISIKEGKICSIYWLNSKLNPGYLPNQNTKGFSVGNLTSQNREEEDEETRQRKQNNNDYGQTL